MIKKPVCIIPARGGSKRIPNKNIKEFHRMPIIMHTINKALKSGLFDEIFVASDSREILDIADEMYINTIKLPPDVCDDHSPTWKAIDYSVNYIENTYHINYEYLCCMYATAPFMRIGDLEEGYNTIHQSKVDAVFPVTTFPFPIQRALGVCNNGYVSMVNPENTLVRSQDLEERYHDVGQFYWLDVYRFKKTHSMYGECAKPIILPRLLVQDIDTLEDWDVASVKYKMLREMGYEI